MRAIDDGATASSSIDGCSLTVVSCSPTYSSSSPSSPVAPVALLLFRPHHAEGGRLISTMFRGAGYRELLGTRKGCCLGHPSRCNSRGGSSNSSGLGPVLILTSLQPLCVICLRSGDKRRNLTTIFKENCNRRTFRIGGDKNK